MPGLARNCDRPVRTGCPFGEWTERGKGMALALPTLPLCPTPFHPARHHLRGNVAFSHQFSLCPHSFYGPFQPRNAHSSLKTGPCHPLPSHAPRWNDLRLPLPLLPESGIHKSSGSAEWEMKTLDRPPNSFLRHLSALASELSLGRPGWEHGRLSVNVW